MENLEIENNRLIFITGGVRSGKSAFAERVAHELQDITGATLTYIATSRRTDGEMEERINRHQKLRALSNRNWKTYEISTNFAQHIQKLDRKGIVLLDCLTVLLANELFTENIPMEKLKKRSRQLIDQLEQALIELQKKTVSLIIVSNETQYEYHGDPFVQLYQWTLGRLHERLVHLSTSAFLVEASIPIQMKGDTSMLSINSSLNE